MIYNLGSINIDYFYKAPHLPMPGETLAATDYQVGLGGKGANQSVACARAGAAVRHIGQIHHKDADILGLLDVSAVDCSTITQGDVPTGHAIIVVDEGSGENHIILMPGANQAITETQLEDALKGASAGDWALAQNETALAVPFLKRAKDKGLFLCYSAAPFVKDNVLAVLPLIDLLIVNEGEADEIAAALGKAPDKWGLPHLIITKGKEGADYYGQDGAFHQPAHPVKAVDSTGAGDTYLGYVLGQISQGASLQEAMALAGKAAALQVTRFGTAAVIPTLAEVEETIFETRDKI